MYYIGSRTLGNTVEMNFILIGICNYLDRNRGKNFFEIKKKINILIYIHIFLINSQACLFSASAFPVT